MPHSCNAVLTLGETPNFSVWSQPIIGKKIFLILSLVEWGGDSTSPLSTLQKIRKFERINRDLH
jgi:hypothetical protein